jgi:SpoIID/LytB domain
MTDRLRNIASLLAVCFVFLALQPAPDNRASAAAISPTMHSTVRVGVWTLWHDRELTVTPANHTLLQTCPRCPAGSLKFSAKLHAERDTVVLTMNYKAVQLDGIWLSGSATLAAHRETLTLPYPIAITAHNGSLVIAATLPVENYVERVVASESGAADTTESLKALAIVVRSYALHETHGHADYDLCDSTHCQLLHWSGNGSRRNAAHAAALATSGETLWFHGQRALAYFNKDCGGRSAAIAEVWPRAHATSYLQSQPDRYCTASGGREWASQISRADLTTALATHGIVRAGWQHLSIAQRGESGRAVTLRLDSSKVNAEDFRIAVGQSLGWNQIPSTWFEVNQQGDRFYFHGRGWGHGIGLCQKGAAAMAAQNRNASEILAQYFPGANTADEQTGRSWQNFVGGGFVLQSLDASDASFLPDLGRARAEAAQRSGMNTPLVITVRVFTSTPAFRDATGAPGWVAAFTEGSWIGAQPLRTLATRHLLDGILRHEFLHALVEHEAGPAAPLWLREGLVELWAEPDAKLTAAPTIKLQALDTMLAHAATEAESATAHRTAAIYASRLIARYGHERTLDFLRSGVPADAAIAVRQR